MNQEFITAVKTSNMAWFENHLAPDFLNSNADGSLSGRAEFLKRAALPIQVGDFAVHDVLVRLFGETAIVHGRTTFTQADGQAGKGRYTDVWAQQSNRWVCVAADVSRG
ncbi:hypothetical protein B0B52_18965 [Polaromonas sp. A23]|nr:hypothetical protein B0B52_18965 [Polaromonas sp. A23]